MSLKKSVIILSAGLLFLHSSCKKEPCDNKPDFTYNLSDDDKKFIPYSGNERLVYLAPNLDTAVIFKGGGAKTYYDEDMEQNGECPTIYGFETKEYIYRAEHIRQFK